MAFIPLSKFSATSTSAKVFINTDRVFCITYSRIRSTGALGARIWPSGDESEAIDVLETVEQVIALINHAQNISGFSVDTNQELFDVFGGTQAGQVSNPPSTDRNE